MTVKFLIFYWLFSLLVLFTISTSLSGWAFIGYLLYGIFFYIIMSVVVTVFVIIKYKRGYVLKDYRTKSLYILLAIIGAAWLGAKGDNGDAGGIAESNVDRIFSTLFHIDTSSMFFTFLEVIGGVCLQILPIVFILYSFFVLKGFTKQEQDLNIANTYSSEEKQFS